MSRSAKYSLESRFQANAFDDIFLDSRCCCVRAHLDFPFTSYYFIEKEKFSLNGKMNVGSLGDRLRSSIVVSLAYRKRRFSLGMGLNFGKGPRLADVAMTGEKILSGNVFWGAFPEFSSVPFICG